MKPTPCRFRASKAQAVLAALVPLLIISCAKKADSEPTPTVAVSSRTTPPPPPSAAPSADQGDPMAKLFGSMASEAKNRPNVHPNVDDGFAAFTKAGVEVPKPQQSLARTYRASYCAHGVIQDNTVSVMLCEYADEKLAADGLVEAKKIFPTLDTRETMGKKDLLFVVTYQTPVKDRTPKTLEEHKKLVAAFNAL